MKFGVLHDFGLVQIYFQKTFKNTALINEFWVRFPWPCGGGGGGGGCGGGGGEGK